LSLTVSAVKTLEEQMAVLRLFVRTHVPHQKAVQELGTIKGVSEEQVSVLLGMLGDTSFAHRDQLVAFVGLDVMARISGKWQGREKLSKRGNPYLRKTLYLMAWGLKQHNPQYREYYRRLYVEEGKHYTTCLMAVARKFLRFLYAYHWKGSVCLQPVA